MTGVSGGHPRPAQLPALTSLRFFAAALIVAYHAGAILGVWDVSGVVAATQGVSFFFVLSGFILAHAYPVLPTRRSVRDFYVARFARIWPVHMATTLAWIGVVYGFDQATVLWNHGGARLLLTVVLLQAWVPVEAWATSFNGVSWSISAELLFYLSFPLIIRLFDRYWAAIVAVEAVLVGSLLYGSVWASATDVNSVDVSGLLYLSPLARLPEFTLGVAAQRVWRRSGAAGPGRRWAGVGWTVLECGCVGVAVLCMLAPKSAWLGAVYRSWAGFYLSAVGSAPAFAALIVVFAAGRGAVSRMLGWRPMVFLGEISFALYLVHYLIVVAMQRAGGGGLGLAYAGVWAVSLGAAAALAVWVERPSRALIVGLGRTRRSPAVPGRT